MLKHLVKPELTVPAHIDFLDQLRDFVTRIGKIHGYSNKLINAFKLAVDEAATNIIRYAYPKKDGFITIRALVKADSLTLCFIDQGIHFNPNSVKNPDLNHYVDTGKKGGLGIFIIRRVMDEIEYRKVPEGNELRITKYCDSSYKRNFICAISTLTSSLRPKYFFRMIFFLRILHLS
ncbi:ATP-binding protein [candidate division KSB1 bacterium]|nr:ATP-binding protein [candidate division KSB1 bacterium]NIR71275.1 ATP-binding protein [candidate division KSB1 bacterium]NIS24804.1 ATP-binding protein [candidate division KSB1 bacterium]NIT71711.1 ATP-binding protein [candidate division KSB1 bacterium]NIU25440.1 ATP-binding protein [candidate division KSB1 bacterium]